MAFKINLKISMLIAIAIYFLFQGLPGLFESIGFTWQFNLFVALVLFVGVFFLK